MPKMEIRSENRVQTGFDFPKLFLEQNERARIVLLEGAEVEYVHQLRTPVMQNGRPMMETQKRKDGSEYQAVKYDFKGRYLCLGDFDTVNIKGEDKKNCPACAVAGTEAVQRAQRRYAMNVLRYRVKPGSWELQEPFNVEVVVWSFTDQNWNKLADFAGIYNDLKKYDLLLGPCTAKTFQKFDIMVAPNAAWLRSEQDRDNAIETFKNNRVENLRQVIGREVSKDQLQEIVDEVKSTTDLAFGRRNDEHITSSDVSAQVDVGGLIGTGGVNDPAAWEQAPKPKPQQAAPVDVWENTQPSARREDTAQPNEVDPWSGNGQPAPPVDVQSPAPAPAAAAVPKLEDLLKGVL